MALIYSDKVTHSNGIQRSVRGLVTASGWDEHNSVTELKLFTTDEDEYIIENGASFIGVLRKFIHAKGSVKKNKYGEKSIEIQEFIIIEHGFGEGF